MIYLILVLLLVWLGFFIWKNKNGEDWEGMIVLCSILVVFYSTITGIIYFSNGGGFAKWQAFYNANVRNYEVAVDKTASYLSVEEFAKQTLIEGSLEKMQLATAISDRIAEWRAAVNEYNSTIASMQYFNRNIWTGVLVPDGVEEMKLLIIK